MDTEEKNWLEDLDTAWSGAEVGIAKVGDLLIDKVDSTYENGYRISTAVRDGVDEYPGLRILKRAPKPVRKLQAVVAGNDYGLDPELREVYVLQQSGEWESEIYLIDADQLVDPVPLVELPSREALIAALKRGYDAWDIANHTLGAPNDYRADAVLELLKGRP